MTRAEGRGREIDILYTVVPLPLTTPVKRTGIRYSVALPHMIFNWHEQ